ncbi:MAG: dUTP diphosphatase [Clostridia bacterium]|nr:dUTP diphosphatase [Clostridia bacterium]
MQQCNLKVKKLDERAVLPRYGSEYAAAADLYAVCDNDIEIAPGETVFVHTGLAMEIPCGCVGLIYARSSLGAKQGLAPANKVGVIDSDYRGEIMVALHNHSGSVRTISCLDRVAQIVITPYIRADFEEADALSDTVRGQGGFGSTGK